MTRHLSALRLALAGGIIALFSSPAQAEPFTFTWTWDDATNGVWRTDYWMWAAQIPFSGVAPGGDAGYATMTVVVDNGGTSSASQSWDASDIVSLEFASGDVFLTKDDFTSVVTTRPLTTNADSTVRSMSIQYFVASPGIGDEGIVKLSATYNTFTMTGDGEAWAVYPGLQPVEVSGGVTDTDGDGIDDDADNCPNDVNADQADADGDLIGDACDADSDGDGTDDDDDNCPSDFNADQADLDQDGDGDVCDDDDDGDGVDDVSDNCPMAANADQADSDGDGDGDVCDGDDDNDGVLDADDLCAGTASTDIDSDGCSGDQYVGLYCDDICDYSNDGQYVSCVSNATNEAKSAGLMTGKEKAAIVREAAKDSCE